MFFMNLSNKIFTCRELERETGVAQDAIRNDTGINDVFDRMEFAGFYQTIEAVVSYLQTNYSDTTERVVLVLPSNDVAFACELIGAVTRNKYVLSDGINKLKVDFYVWNETKEKHHFEYVSIL